MTIALVTIRTLIIMGILLYDDGYNVREDLAKRTGLSEARVQVRVSISVFCKFIHNITYIT